MCGTLKVAILENDALCKDFVVCSIYDSKLGGGSSGFPYIKWMQKDLEVWHPGIERKIKAPLYSFVTIVTLV